MKNGSHKYTTETPRKPKGSRAQMESVTPRSSGPSRYQKNATPAPKGYAIKKHGNT